jgi:hypothetical protein
MPGRLLGSRGGDVAGARNGSWSRLCLVWFCLATKPSHVRDNVDGLACFLHCPTVYGWQMWLQCSLTGATLSCRATAVDGAFSGGARPLELDIYRGVDRPGIGETEYYVEKLMFTRACLSRVRVTMMIMCVPLV